MATRANTLDIIYRIHFPTQTNRFDMVGNGRSFLAAQLADWILSNQLFTELSPRLVVVWLIMSCGSIIMIVRCGLNDLSFTNFVDSWHGLWCCGWRGAAELAAFPVCLTSACLVSLHEDMKSKLNYTDSPLKQAEERIQQECFQWHWNTYPKLRGLLCYNLNNSRNEVDGARNKRLGLIAGRADMTYYFWGRAYFIEMKTPTGSQSPEQKEWEQTVIAFGFEYVVVRSLAEFQNVVEAIHEAHNRKFGAKEYRLIP